MRDDPPTQQFDPHGNDASNMGSPPGQEPEKQKSRRIVIILALVIAVVIIAVIALILSLNKPDDSASPATSTPPTEPTATESSPEPTTDPTATSSPTTEPTSTSTTTTEPPAEGASVDLFTVTPSSAPDCSGGDPEIIITWATSNAVAVYFGIDTNDASTGPFFSDLPASGSSASDFPAGYSPFYFSCPGSGNSHRYALTAVDSEGGKDTKLIDLMQP